MESIARNQFPIIIWRERNKLLWNPIHKKALKNRPEERVRLRILEYLLQAGWSRHRITTEEAIPDYAAEKLRTDIICYSQSFEPKILVECKAENVSLTNRTAEQVSRYNRNIKAPYVLISNGRTDLWYQVDNSKGRVEKLENLPETLSDPEEPSLSFDYWRQRGFAGNRALPELRRWMEPILKEFRTNDNSTIRYLQFNKSPTDLKLNHYYHVFDFQQQKVALSFLNTSFGGTRLFAILNKEGVNRAVAEVNLDLIFEDENPNSSIYSSEGVQNFDFREVSEDIFQKDLKGSNSHLNDLSSTMNSLFNKYLP